MAIDVYLRTLDGKKKELLEDPDGSLNRLWPIGDRLFPLLQYIDPYGTTVFGATQASQVQKELKALIERTTNDRDRNLLICALSFAERLGQHPHWFLWFQEIDCRDATSRGT